MGAAKGHESISDAAGGLATYTNVARFALKDFFADQRGTTAIEYAVIASLISIAIVAGAETLGNSLKAFFESVKF
jgi:pilus assembly protein Flp/PilA